MAMKEYTEGVTRTDVPLCHNPHPQTKVFALIHLPLKLT